ncbi:alpha/beta hydrolase [Streptomyces sp. NBC_00525]|uniref:alpha/beta hydrolase n=1 Tax=Streptomyces sp. NBC_00525 TaxID=2903660 RepID=UPI002E80DCF5|nr:alpha/beta hydrolase [Streptomyces sp. NBC_00525]WUC96170.1 alpha/beta hydrolase family protein [Streptomyces sp. NBC_00525]
MPELFAQLLRQDFSDLEAAADSWQKLAAALDDTRTGSGKRVSGPLHKAGWAGVAAHYGFAALEATESKLLTARTNARLLGTVLGTFSTRMQEAQRKLRHAVSDAESAGHTVTEDGWVEARHVVDPAYHNDPEYAGAQQRANAGLGGFRARIDATLAEARQVSDEATGLLRQIDPFDLDKQYGGAQAAEDAERVGKFAGLSREDIPDGKHPQRAADWWAGLTAGERAFYLAAFPDEIGGLDGLPATARDDANRMVLDSRLNDYALREGDLGHHDRAGYRGLAALKDRLDLEDAAPAHKRLYLLGFDTSKDGRAIVAVGNPDTARHTAVQVPGTSNQLDNVDGQINRASKLQDAAADWTGPAGPRDIAVVSWLDYNAPEARFNSVVDLELNLGIATQGRAQDGAEDLRDFTHGLRAAHEGERSHLTVLSHSYGSTVVGAADSAGRGLDADDMVVVGSPGMAVGRADQLHIDPEHLYVGTAKDDWVSNTFGDTTLGADPKEAEFGAQRMYVDTTGHGGYWDDGSRSLENQGRIIAGLTPRNGSTG